MTQAEISIREFVDSFWFRLLSRGAAILGSLLAMAVGGYFFVLGDRVTKIEQDRAVKIVEFNGHLTSIDEKITDLQQTVAALAADSSAARQDTAQMKGILQQMQRQQTAYEGSPAALQIPIPDPASP